jgi:hypothetical protein
MTHPKHPSQHTPRPVAHALASAQSKSGPTLKPSSEFCRLTVDVSDIVVIRSVLPLAILLESSMEITVETLLSLTLAWDVLVGMPFAGEPLPLASFPLFIKVARSGEEAVPGDRNMVRFFADAASSIATSSAIS